MIPKEAPLTSLRLPIFAEADGHFGNLLLVVPVQAQCPRQREFDCAFRHSSRRKHCVQVLVRDNNVDQALKALKKKMQREGIFREMKLRGHYEKPSEKKAREKAEAIRRARKLARKRLQREGLLPMKAKPAPAVGRPGAPRRVG
jgi:small subunit ribosomal protein S21